MLSRSPQRPQVGLSNGEEESRYSISRRSYIALVLTSCAFLAGVAAEAEVGGFGLDNTPPAPTPAASGRPWTVRSFNNTLHSVVWSGTQYVAVGENGYIGTSPDAVIWTGRSSGTIDHLYDIVWTGNKYVVVGGYGTILFSQDGINWNRAAISSEATTNYSLAWSGTKFVATGAYGQLATSADGENWNIQPTPSTDIRNLIWTGSQFAGTCGSYAICVSSDGVNWTVNTTGSSYALGGVAWSGSQYVAVGSHGTVFTSTDAIQWADIVVLIITRLTV